MDSQIERQIETDVKLVELGACIERKAETG